MKFFDHKGIDPADIKSVDDMDSLCDFNPSAAHNQGCWSLYEDGVYSTSVDYFTDASTGQVRNGARNMYEAVDEMCECIVGYEHGCIARIPFYEPNMPFFSNQVISGPANTPQNYLDFCVFAAVVNGDVDMSDASLTEDATECGCLWIDAVEEGIDDCPGVELGDFD